MLAIFLCGAFLVNAAQSQQTPPPNVTHSVAGNTRRSVTLSPVTCSGFFCIGLQLDPLCHLPYMIPSSSCTCRKINPRSEGVVQWIFPNGTLANQTSDPQNGTSTLIVESPYTYALNQSYICQNVAAGAKLNYTARFAFGPESAILRWLEEPKEPIYLCPSNETKELTLVCEVPSDSINPQPVFTAFIDQNRYGAYDRLPGQKIEKDHVWRLTLNFKLTGLGNHTVICHVSNMYYSANWFALQQTIFTSDQAPSSLKC